VEPAVLGHSPADHSNSAQLSFDKVDGMRVLMVASEGEPFAKTGGLADVLGALPRALVRLGHEVDVVMPRYRGIEAEPTGRVTVTLGGMVVDAAILAATREGVRTVFVDHPDYFDRDYLYGASGHDYPDNPERFAFLTLAALTWAFESAVRYDVAHAHDWQTGLLPVQLTQLFRMRRVSRRIPCVFTIHNLAYQGVFTPDWLPRLDLGWELFTLDRLEYWGGISFLKGGITDADLVTTVSARYAEEIQTPELGFGFDGILRARRADLAGILNGIDTHEWDPAHDRFLPAPYDADNLSGKMEAKPALLRHYGLPLDDATRQRPLVGMVSRMVDQKGFDLIAALADDLTRVDASFVVLGTGEPRYQDLWRRLAAEHPDRIGARIGFDESLAHRIEAGADIFLMPSRFEPCGLNQMYSMRYGTVPVVHAVGGLADTVRDHTPRRARPTGFVFHEYSPAALLEALARALTLFADARKWRAVQVAGMQQDFSWDRSAREYVKIYERAIVKRLGPKGSGRPLAAGSGRSRLGDNDGS